MRFLKPSDIDEWEFYEFVGEFITADEKFTPHTLDQKGMEYEKYIDHLNSSAKATNLPEGWVPESTHFLVDDEGKIHGSASIRHYLTDKLLLIGGHVGYGVRKSSRGNGYGSLLLKLSLQFLQTIDVKKALVTCDKSNLASAKVIKNNSGILDSEGVVDDVIIQRYWISILADE